MGIEKKKKRGIKRKKKEEEIGQDEKEKILSGEKGMVGKDEEK